MVTFLEKKPKYEKKNQQNVTENIVKYTKYQ